MIAAQSNCSLHSQFEGYTPAQIRDRGATASSSAETITRRTLKKQLSAYKNATADCSQVYDGHDMGHQESKTCRRNRGNARAELDKMFSYCPVKNDKKRNEKNIGSVSSPATSTGLTSRTATDTKKAIDMAAGFADFNQDDRSFSTVSTAPSSCATVSSTSSARVKKNCTTTAMPKPSVPKPIAIPKHVNSSSTGNKSEVTSSSSTQTAIRRKKSRPCHRNHEMNLKLVSVMRSPRYSKCRPGDLCSSLQDLGVNASVVDERLTKSMTDLETDWGDSIDFNNVHFKSNVEVYMFKS